MSPGAPVIGEVPTVTWGCWGVGSNCSPLVDPGTIPGGPIPGAGTGGVGGLVPGAAACALGAPGRRPGLPPCSGCWLGGRAGTRWPAPRSEGSSAGADCLTAGLFVVDFDGAMIAGFTLRGAACTAAGGTVLVAGAAIAGSFSKRVPAAGGVAIVGAIGIDPAALGNAPGFPAACEEASSAESKPHTATAPTALAKTGALVRIVTPLDGSCAAPSTCLAGGRT
jgi:hypothetical protein